MPGPVKKGPYRGQFLERGIPEGSSRFSKEGGLHPIMTFSIEDFPGEAATTKY